MKFQKQLQEVNNFINNEDLSNFTVFFTTEIGGKVHQAKFSKHVSDFFVLLDKLNALSVTIRNDFTGEGKLWNLEEN